MSCGSNINRVAGTAGVGAGISPLASKVTSYKAPLLLRLLRSGRVCRLCGDVIMSGWREGILCSHCSERVPYDLGINPANIKDIWRVGRLISIRMRRMRAEYDADSIVIDGKRCWVWLGMDEGKSR